MANITVYRASDKYIVDDGDGKIYQIPSDNFSIVDTGAATVRVVYDPLLTSTKVWNGLAADVLDQVGNSYTSSSLALLNVLSASLSSPITFGDTGAIDAFARLRVSNPHTIFDSKQLNDNLASRWDDIQFSGTGATSFYNTNEASTTLSVSNLTAGKRIRQTFMRFNYQPAKSQLVFMTTTVGRAGGGTGIIRSVGQFDDKNGIFFRDNEGTLQVVIRSYVTGTAIDRAVNQVDWNIDTMDGNGSSTVLIDPTKAQIVFFDYEWLGVGRARMGFIISGIPIYCHEFLNSNTTLSKVYMSTPNNPLRYEIENDGTGAASSMDHICCSVISEGGQQELGIVHYASTAGTHVDANTANTIYAIVGIKLKSTHIDTIVKELAASILEETKADFEWLILLNPTVSGTFTYVDHDDSAIQVALGNSTNTVTLGHEMGGGFATSSAPASVALPSAIYIGSTILGVSDELILCVRPLSSNADIQAGLTWRELT